MSASDTSKLSSYIGLAQRANAVLYGEDIICERLRLAKVVVIYGGAPEKFKQRLQNKVKDCCPVFQTEQLREALHRDNVNAIAVTNDGLASAIIELLR